MKKQLIALAAAAALVAVLGLAACDGGNGNGNGGGNDPQPTPAPTPSTDPTPNPQPGADPTPTPDVKSVTVSDLYRYTGVYKDPAGYEITFVYLTPDVEGPDTDYIFDIKMFVQKLTREKIDPSIEAMERGDSPGYVDVEYQAQAIGNMITLLMTWRNQYDRFIEYQVWVIKADGTMAENSELFAAKGVTEEQVLAKVRESVKPLLDSPDGDYGDLTDLVKEAYEKTMSDANINGHLPFYINDEGHLAVVVKVYSIAGAAYYNNFLDLGF